MQGCNGWYCFVSTELWGKLTPTLGSGAAPASHIGAHDTSD